MVFPHRRALRARLSLSGISKGLVLDKVLPAMLGVVEDKVMTGGTPVNPAALVRGGIVGTCRPSTAAA
jgi:hypothetical protein